MSNRVFFTVLSVISLFIGASIYLLFRNNVIFMRPFLEFGFISNLRNTFDCKPLNTLSCYLPDICWSFSLCCALLATFNGSRTNALGCALTAFLCGTIWEILQLFSVISGTADLIDIMLYLLGSICATTISFRRRKGK